MPGPAEPPSEPAAAGIGASPKTNLAFPQVSPAYDAKLDPRTPILSADEKKVFVDTFARTGFTGGINWNLKRTRNWRRAADLQHTVGAPRRSTMATNMREL